MAQAPALITEPLSDHVELKLPGPVDTSRLPQEGFHVPIAGNPPPAGFRDEIIALARRGSSVEGLSQEVEAFAATIAGLIGLTGIDGSV